MLTVISVGIMFGFFLSLDLILAKKDKGYFKRSFIIVFTSTLPLLYGVFFENKNITTNIINLQIWNDYFYVIFISTLFISLILSYNISFKQMTKNLEYYKYGNLKNYNFLDFIFMGYNEFKNEIEQLKRNATKDNELNNSDILDVHKKLSTNLPLFIKEIYDAGCKEFKLEDYITFVMSKFVSIFFAENNARFTFRELNEETNCMVTVLSTKIESKPSPIPLDKKNLITLSAEKGEPVIFSRNVDHHYDTGKTIKNKIFNDYVAYCLMLTKEGKPYFSINLDVKEGEAAENMKALVDSSIFTIVSNAIVLKIENNLEESEASEN
jgi:hypothetical protein